MKKQVRKNSGIPRYPTKDEVAINPTLLKNQPQYWYRQPLLTLSLMALLSSGLLACKKTEEPENDSRHNYGELEGVVGYLPATGKLTEKEAIAVLIEELEESQLGLQLQDFLDWLCATGQLQ